MQTKLDSLIVGGGISGLTIAHKLKLLCPGHRLLILEKSARPGGAIRSFADQGYLAEIGPHGFLDNCQESRDLLSETGLDKECVKAPLKDFVRYVCMDGSLRMIPQSPAKIIAAPLISPLQKIRALGEFFKKPLGGEPTVAQWVTYRFGVSLAPYVDAVFTGTYAGDFERLLIDGVMPGVRRLEKEHGSVIKGLLKKLRAAKKSGAAKKGLPAMTSFPDGMETLAKYLSKAHEVDGSLLLDTAIDSIARADEGWVVGAGDKEYLTENLVLALPVNAALDLLERYFPAPLPPKIPEAGILSIAFGFAGETKLPPGFGYLAPEQEKRFCLGALFSSNMFAGRAPDGCILFEALIGGRRHPERLELDDETLIRKSLVDLAELLDLRGEPLYAKVLRPKGGIPQLEAGYLELLEWRDELMAKEKGLYLSGFGWEGIGLNDMIKTACRVAEAIRRGTKGESEEAAVKGVYF